MSERVFISYRTCDKSEAIAVRRALETSHFDVWMDTDRINFGEAVQKEIQEALQPDVALVVIVSKRTFESQWVMFELNTVQHLRPPPTDGIFLYLTEEVPVPKELHHIRRLSAYESGSVNALDDLKLAITKWSRSSYLYHNAREDVTSLELLAWPTVFSVTLAIAVHCAALASGLFPVLALKSSLGILHFGATLFVSVLYAVFLGPISILLSRRAILKGQFQTAAANERRLVQLYDQQQRKIIFYFAIAGCFSPLFVEISWGLLSGGAGLALTILVTSVVIPFFFSGIMSRVLDRLPGGNPVFPTRTW